MWRTFLGMIPVIVSGKQDPTFGADGVLHAHSSNSLYAVNRDGSTKWIFDAGARLGSHAEGLSGTVYATTATAGTGAKVRDTLFALDGTDGSIKWTHENALVDMRYNPLAVAADGTVYFASLSHDTGPTCDNTTIDAIDTDGSLRWTSTVAGCGSLSAVGADGTLFVEGGLSGSLSALWPDTGTVKWSVAFDHCEPMSQHPIIAFAKDSNVVFILTQSEQSCSEFVLSSLSIEDGSVLWKVPLSKWPSESGHFLKFSSFMNLGSNDEVYVNGMTENGTCSLRVFHFNGNPLRNLPCLRGSAHYGDDEDVFVTVDSGLDIDTNYVWAHSGTDGHLLWNVSVRDSLRGMPMQPEVRFGQDGTVFVWSHRGSNPAPTYAIRNGDVAWSVPGTQQLTSEDGTTYVFGSTYVQASYPVRLVFEIVAVGADGAEKWRCQPTEAAAEFV